MIDAADDERERHRHRLEQIGLDRTRRRARPSTAAGMNATTGCARAAGRRERSARGIPRPPRASRRSGSRRRRRRGSGWSKPSRSPARIRWPVLEIGRNSVRPSTMPRTQCIKKIFQSGISRCSANSSPRCRCRRRRSPSCSCRTRRRRRAARSRAAPSMPAESAGLMRQQPSCRGHGQRTSESSEARSPPFAFSLVGDTFQQSDRDSQPERPECAPMRRNSLRHEHGNAAAIVRADGPWRWAAGAAETPCSSTRRWDSRPKREQHDNTG